MINREDLDFWFKNNLNVALVGHRGVGKSSIILDAWKRLGIMGKYFNGPTMDPFVDLIGVPRAAEDEQGEYLHFIKPRELNYEELESIFVDEPNRAPKKVRDALLELILFKSINGTTFPKLRNIVIAYNPPSMDGISYDVDDLDPAFLDRFDIQYKVPYECDVDYFRNKYGKEIADPAIEWWREIPLENRIKNLPPRRLDMMLNLFTKGGDLSHCAPEDCKLDELLKRIDSGSILDQIKTLRKKGSDSSITKFVKKTANRDILLKYMMDDEDLESFFMRFLTQEHIVVYCQNSYDAKVQGTYQGSFGNISVLRAAVSIAKSCWDDTFRNRINKTFGGKKSAVLNEVQMDLNKAICAVGTPLKTTPKEIHDYDLNMDNHIDRCMLVNTLYQWMQDGTGTALNPDDVKKLLAKTGLESESKLSCVSKKYNEIKAHYGLS